MLNPEMKAILGYTDAALQDLIDYLDKTVGEDKWVLAMTADHGQAPDPQAAHAWPIRIQYLEDDVNKRFDTNDNDVDLFQDERPVGFWVDRAEMDANGVTMEEISDFLINYRLKENIKPNEDLPDQYDTRLEEPVLAAAFPGEAMNDIWRCAKEKAAS
jgi:predicted AlkP superfamily pyrophosphatase or phosphodiesterase